MDKEEILIDLSKYESKFTVWNKLGRIFWNVFYLFLFRPFGFRFFNKWRVLILRLFGAKIDWNAVVYGSAKIWAPWNLKMAAYSCLGPNVDCYNQGHISIGESATVSQKSYLCASTHDYKDIKHALILKPIVIENQVWIAADAFIGPGVTVKEGSVVGARAAVFKDVEPWTVVGGNPAKYLKERAITNFR